MPETAHIRAFLAGTTSKVVAIATEDLIELLDHAERSRDIPPQVPALATAFPLPTFQPLGGRPA